MTIKEQVAAIEAAMKTKDINELLVTAQVMTLVASLQLDDTEVPPDVFEPMSKETRKICLLGLALVMCETIND